MLSSSSFKMSGDVFVHPLEIRGLCLMKSPEEMVLKICHAFEIQKKSIFIVLFHTQKTWQILMCFDKVHFMNHTTSYL